MLYIGEGLFPEASLDFQAYTLRLLPLKLQPSNQKMPWGSMTSIVFYPSYHEGNLIMNFNIYRL
jgi:hypothetical protein